MQILFVTKLQQFGCSKVLVEFWQFCGKRPDHSYLFGPFEYMYYQDIVKVEHFYIIFNFLSFRAIVLLLLKSCSSHI